MWHKRHINKANILLAFFILLMALCSCQFNKNEANVMPDNNIANNSVSQENYNEILSSDMETPSIVFESKEELRELDKIYLTDLSKEKDLMEYSQGEMFNELEIYQLAYTQLCTNSQWEDLKVYVEFHGPLQITGTVFYNKDAPSSFIISEESYSSVPAIIVNDNTYPKEIGIDIDSIINEYGTEMEGNDSGVINNVTLVFETFIITYARESGMTSGVKVIDVY